MEIILVLWHAWTSLFADIPFGDPYFAVFALGVLLWATGRVMQTIFEA